MKYLPQFRHTNAENIYGVVLIAAYEAAIANAAVLPPNQGSSALIACSLETAKQAHATAVRSTILTSKL